MSKGADPKSVVCAYFKQGLCGKGDKCKYSHDLNLERKGEKRSLYVDSRDDELQQGSKTLLLNCPYSSEEQKLLLVFLCLVAISAAIFSLKITI